MVVIFLPTASLTEVWQERTASPLTWTVQAPHRPAPQPNLVPVICNCSRMTQSSGVSLAASTDTLRPLILRLGISSPLPVYEAAYGGSSLSGWLAAHRVSGQLPRRMIPIVLRGNAIWNWSKKKLFLRAVLVHCGRLSAAPNLIRLAWASSLISAILNPAPAALS